jgi:hypothetical protein
MKKKPILLLPGRSSPMSVRFGTKQASKAYVFADANHKTKQTTILSFKTGEVIGIVNTIERYPFLKAVRWLLTLRESIEQLPTLFLKVNPKVLDPKQSASELLLIVEKKVRR